MYITPLDAIPAAIPAERRRTRRIPVNVAVEVEIGDERRIARLTELSRAGGRVSLRGTWPSGQSLVIRRGDFELEAVIVWTDGSAAGLWFPTPLDEGSFVKLRTRARD